ncbi:hypothetical protein NPIL_82781 [Nephila pilipes]|uniref:Uncharacterized protein n=1 Tax=Nephila pilipes TaxID=299642 RepID=A0A8X6U086_NEPPI|nr:hypothetical protein NPIL_82781 [Nephila pilipes]
MSSEIELNPNKIRGCPTLTKSVVNHLIPSSEVLVQHGGPKLNSGLGKASITLRRISGRPLSFSKSSHRKTSSHSVAPNSTLYLKTSPLSGLVNRLLRLKSLSLSPLVFSQLQLVRIVVTGLIVKRSIAAPELNFSAFDAHALARATSLKG